MNHEDDEFILNLPAEWIVQDPREALCADYRDGVRTARATLVTIVELSESGHLPRLYEDWWVSFLKELLAAVRAETKPDKPE